MDDQLTILPDRTRWTWRVGVLLMFIAAPCLCGATIGPVEAFLFRQTGNRELARLVSRQILSPGVFYLMAYIFVLLIWNTIDLAIDETTAEDRNAFRKRGIKASLMVGGTGAIVDVMMEGAYSIEGVIAVAVALVFAVFVGYDLGGRFRAWDWRKKETPEAVEESP